MMIRRERQAHLIATVLLVCCIYAIKNLVTDHVPKPYMDEVFHIPQAQRYCRYELTSWDDKITTLPGLYLTSAVNNWFSYMSCSIDSLRSQIVFMYGCVFFILFWLVSDDNNDFILKTVKALRIVLFPLLFSFSYLYYTDVGSTLFVLVSYMAYRSNVLKMSAIFSAIAVFYRQTNIIWAFWIACQLVVDRFEGWYQIAINNQGKDQSDSNSNNSKDLNQFTALLHFLRVNFVHIIQELWWFALLGLVFVAFVGINGGIVVGDRSNHQVIIHVTQIFYFSVFCCFMLPFHFLSFLMDLLKDRKNLLRAIVIVLLGSPVAAYLAYRFSHVHMFILSDNRHFIFYIWRRLFKIHMSPSIPFMYFAAYSPLFMLSILFIVHLLQGKFFLFHFSNDQRTFTLTLVLTESKISTLRILTYLVCTCLNLIPLPLVEFRYFIIPYILLSALEKRGSRLTEIATLIYYLVINAATLYLFVYKPFVGPDGKEARFMW